MDCRHGLPTSRHGSGRKAKAPGASGFTLIELMIAIAIVTILAGIALPSYAEYVRRGHLSAAFETLGTYRMRLEQVYQDGYNYGVANCAVAAPPATAQFQFTCTLTDSGQGFTATATGINAMVGYTFTTDSSGAYGTTAFPRASGLPKSCWLTRATDC